MLKGLLNPVINGFKVMASEAKWVLIKGFRCWEIRQMKKRIDEEYQALGKSYAESRAKNEEFDPQTSDNDLTLRQISFLLEELEHLKAELTATRSEYVKNRSAASQHED